LRNKKTNFFKIMRIPNILCIIYAIRYYENLTPQNNHHHNCVKFGASITGGDRQYLVVCPYCGVEYRFSISAVVVEYVDHVAIKEKINTLIACVLSGNLWEREDASLEPAKPKDGRIVEPAASAFKDLLLRDDRGDPLTVKTHPLPTIIRACPGRR